MWEIGKKKIGTLKNSFCNHSLDSKHSLISNSVPVTVPEATMSPLKEHYPQLLHSLMGAPGQNRDVCKSAVKHKYRRSPWQPSLGKRAIGGFPTGHGLLELSLINTQCLEELIRQGELITSGLCSPMTIASKGRSGGPSCSLLYIWRDGSRL